MARKTVIDDTYLKKRQYMPPRRRARTVVCRILIVCEGEKTEPNYFKSFNKTRRGVFVYDVEARGEGKNTMDVVAQAIKEKEMAEEKGTPYDSVWAVFDRDSFPAEKFNNAINKADGHDVNCAWSNEAFELWYLLHFQYRNTGMRRDKYREAISDAVNNCPEYKTKKKGYKYTKNSGDNYNIMNDYGSQSDAIKRAEKLHNNFTDRSYHLHNPCTLVYKLVTQLIGKDEVFNKKIEATME